MNGNKKGIRIMPVNILRAVTVMTIGIDNGDPADGGEFVAGAIASESKR